ncbi:hypothetical protein [Blastococcus litoris]|uniref:hypothetical protein n=1 Tax=Blastococcus litoris TaxID=2171622 RepID=UPI000E300BC7|nr:hypothetical protein [Blastococcus litoris]
MWWLWVLGGLVAWMAIAVVVGTVLGRGIRQADLRAAGAAAPDLRVAAERRAPVVRERRRAIPVPPIGVALFGVAVALEIVGYVGRLTGASGPTADLLSMDAPWSLPRLFVAALFAAAALAAVAGAGSIPGRRTWWLAIGLVAGGIAAVKAGSTVHSDVMALLSDAVSDTGALLVSAGAAVAVLAGLAFLSRTERRDRRRMLGVLALYAAASVGLSAVSSAVAGAVGSASNWAAAATFVEESGEALAGVSFLVAVLVGVAPRLVLPAEWALRRSADEHTLDLPEQLPSRAEGTAHS